MWHAAYTIIIPKNPTCGWELENNAYSIVWFDGPQMLESVVPDPPNESEDDEEYPTTEDDTDDSDSDKLDAVR